MRDDGGAAFPDPGRAQSEKQRAKLGNPGMSLRDYFAGQALAGLLANAGHDTTFANLEGLMNNTWAIANAMIAEREKP